MRLGETSGDEGGKGRRLDGPSIGQTERWLILVGHRGDGFGKKGQKQGLGCKR